MGLRMLRTCLHSAMIVLLGTDRIAGQSKDENSENTEKLFHPFACQTYFRLKKRTKLHQLVSGYNL